MSLKLNTKYLEGFVSEHEYEGMAAQVTAAHNTLVNRNGLGNDFLGWVTLPEDYDKEEFARIKAAAARIKEKCDVLIVIGIGGSYLGARAAIELLKSPFYNNLKKDTPDIYFVGNNISSAYLNEVLSICEGRDICVNVISKSGTTTTATSSAAASDNVAATGATAGLALAGVALAGAAIVISKRK